ncbi:peptidase M24, structural domain-containing protein [Podospora aff. communis PSN243]|uniref:Probable Xaa-Pro aminopeptidase P n=1 Tax=Podospora aff. communis PSN243 TaxID=3040156 RepID=A0AAV9GPI9_9PEZI|nr:peptidase M24, structural domain-containing protein [Podospora aff. communis PSN243]
MRYKVAQPCFTAFISPFRTLEVCCPRAPRAIPVPIAPTPRFPIKRPFHTTAVPRFAVTQRRQEEMVTVNTTSRLAALRSLMKERKLDIYVVPSEDSHASEYVAECDGRRAFISGFSGSAGTAVVTLEKAALATDGRYFNQASKQLDSNWELLKQGLQDVPTWQDWAADEAAGGKTVGLDPTLIPSSVAEKLHESIKKNGGTGLEAVSENLVDLVWGSERPARPSESIKLLPEKYSGKDSLSKLTDLRKELEKKKSAGFVVSLLDEVAWLFNLRGSDIAYNPVFFSYAIVTQDSAILYADSSKLTPEAQSYLADNKIAVKPYDELFADTKALASQAAANGDGATPKKYLISTKASWALKLALGGDKFVEEVRSPVGDAKAIKNETELNGMRQCHIRDGAALTEFFAWLEDQLIDKKAVLDEVAAADKLEEIRSKHQDFVGLSFDTISSTGANAAVIHYKPEKGSCGTIDPNAIYLCDSGAQYFDGTTDTTRTLHFGTPTRAEKTAYTLVLKGNIALDSAVFPKGTSGFAIDCLARQFLWKSGLDYRHGTGHGVGSFLCVHEGPIGIGTRKQYIDVPLAAGNVLSIEPGYYEDGAYGIRIENLAIVREVKTENSFGDKPYLGFEHVTMVPYCRNLIDVSLLTEDEKKWLNDSNKQILANTEHFFKDDPVTHKWLLRETQPF